MPRSKDQRFVTAVYLCYSTYGGPEEGGWWYTSGDRIRTLRVFKNIEDAYRYANRFNELLDRIGANKGRPPLSSVACEGRYHVQIYGEMAPEHFPQHRPHYE